MSLRSLGRSHSSWAASPLEMTEETRNLFNRADRGSGVAPCRATDRFKELPMAQAALEFASIRHAGQYREVDRARFVTHPTEVGELLQADGQPDQVVAAGLLHDVLEKTATTSAELRHRFGSRVAQLVETVSVDQAIRDHNAGKRAVRDRVAHADSDSVEIFAADKIAKVRELSLLPPRRLDEPHVREKLANYRASLEMLRQVASDAPLVERLDVELNRLVAPAIVAARPCPELITRHGHSPSVSSGGNRG
jgi:HD domain